MSYVYLTLAIVSEIAATSLLKLSQGFSKMLFGILALVLYGLCFFILVFERHATKSSVCYLVGCWFGWNNSTIYFAFS